MSKLSKQDLKRAKRREKKNFRQAMEKELREHKSSFIVFYTLRLLVIVIFRQGSAGENFAKPLDIS